MTESFDSSNLMLLRCSLTLVLNCLLVLRMKRHSLCNEFYKLRSLCVCIFFDLIFMYSDEFVDFI